MSIKGSVNYMKELNIGLKIAAKRNEKGVTQEELANFLGVSKPAISKWESGQTYPDITLLPILASYFNITVDEIIGYEPQMSKEEIQELYKKLAKEFTIEPFETVYNKCMKYQKRYYSCFNLQFHIALILINHSNLAKDSSKVLLTAVDILKRTIAEGEDVNLKRTSICLLGYSFIAMNDPDSAIKNLEKIQECHNHIDPEVILASAYSMKGKNEKAISVLQEYIYICTMGILGAVPSLMMLYSDKKDKVQKWTEAIMKIEDALDVQEISPSTQLTILITAAQISMMHKDEEAALNFLEKYVGVASNHKLFPLKLQGNDFFDSLQNFFDSLDLGIQPPRNDEMVKRDIKELLMNPIFQDLKSNEKYQSLVERIRRI